MPKIICPHCGAENPKSPIVTTCQQCLGSLEGTEPTPEPADVPPPPATPAVPPAPVEAEEPEQPPVEPTALPPSWTPPPAVVPPEPQPETEAPLAPEPSTIPQTPPVTPPTAPPDPSLDTVSRQLRRQIGGKDKAPACCVGAGIAVAVAALIAFAGGILATVSGSGAMVPVLFVALIIGAVGIVIAIFVIRAYLATSFYDATIDAAPGSVMLGESFQWGITVIAKRSLTVGTVSITLKCQEHAINRGGTSDSHYRKTLHEQRFETPGKPLNSGEYAEFRATVTIPPDAIPSHRSRNNFIEWSLEVRAPVPGYCPDIKDETELWVRPCVSASTGAGLPDDPDIPASWLPSAPVGAGQARLGAAWGTLQLQDGTASDQSPIMAVGASRQLYLWVQTQEEIGCRGVWCWVGCRIHGSGSDEEIELLPEHEIHAGPLVPDQPIGYPIQVSVPASGPVSFVGRYVKLEWVARVRFDIPLWFDKRMWVPFIVTPERLPAPGPD